MPAPFPCDYHAFTPLIGQLLAADPNMRKSEVKQGIKQMWNYPLDMDDPFWDAHESARKTHTRPRRDLFNNKFDLAWRRFHGIP